jgi:trk system potassium uptake protein TrkH
MSEGRPSRVNRFLRVIDRVTLGVAVMAVLTLLVDLGWIPTLQGHARTWAVVLNAAVVCLFLFEYFARAFLASSILRHIRENIFDTVLTVTFLALALSARYLYRGEGGGGALRGHGITLDTAYLVLGQVYILLALISKAVAYQRELATAKFKPAWVVVASFAIVIAMGTVLLCSPHALSEKAAAGEGRISVIDAFFTAASAVCVTGLTVKDIGTYFSTFGQVVIMGLIQVGGLGLMTFVAFSSLIIGKGLALSERVVMQDVLSYEVMNRLPRMLVFILSVTFGTEALGAAVMYFTWHGDYTVGERVYLSAFHAVSAYCNAGFSLLSANLVEYRNSFALVTAVTGLIIFGGIGFTVQGDLIGRVWYYIKARARGRRRLLKNLAAAEGPVYLSTHSKVVLTTTAALLVSGTILFAVLEWTGTLGGMGLEEKALASWFQSVTPRTAGFNTVDIGMLKLTTLVMLMAMMFVGASPGGTGGGIKTSTFAVIIATVRATLRNRLNVEMFKRTIPLQTIRQALAVVFLSILLVASGAFVLALSDPGISLDKLLFEEVSAFGTVGLSMGTAGTPLGPTPLSLSAALSWAGKLVIILTMFAGRIGALTLLVAIAQKTEAAAYEYPSERVTVG